MALGYGYVRDDDPVQINWREISKNFTDRLQADEASRNKRKADIQQSYNDFQKDLINRPQGYNTDLNTAISSFSNQASQASLANLNALKSGQITEQEFYRRRANLKGSTENMFQYANNFNGKYDFYMKRALDGISSKEEIFMKELFQNYTNFKDITPIIDPSSNEVLFVKLDKDGKVTDEAVDVTQLGFMSEYQKDKYDLGAAITDKLKQFGLKTIREADGREVSTLFDAAVDQKEFNNAIEKLADEILSVDENLRSVLTDTLGYDFTTDTAELDKVFYNQKTNEFEETDQQRIDARNHVISEIKARIPRKEIAAPEKSLIEAEREKQAIIRTELLEDQLAESKLSEENKQKAITDVTNFVTNQFPLVEENINLPVNEKNIAALVESGLQSLGFALPRKAVKGLKLTYSIPGGDDIVVDFSDSQTMKDVVDKLTISIFNNKDIADIAKLGKVSSILFSETPDEEAVEETVTKKKLPQ